MLYAGVALSLLGAFGMKVSKIVNVKTYLEFVLMFVIFLAGLAIIVEFLPI